MNFLKKWNMGYTKTLAESGDRESAYKIGNYYYEGKIVEQDFEEAAKWFTDASRYGSRRVDAERNGGLKVLGIPHPKALETLARCYRDGTGVKKNIFYALLLFAKAIRCAGDRLEGKEKEFIQSCAQKQGGELLKQLIEANNSLNAKIQYCAGYACYFYGVQLLPDVFNKSDKKMALSILEKAYQNGYADAAHLIARHLKYTEKNPDKALEWLKNGAERDGIISQFELGEVYWSGDDKMKIEKNRDVAVNWYLKVCDHKDVDLVNINYVRKSMNEIGYYYYREKNYEQAIKFLNQAIAKPNDFNPFDYINGESFSSLGDAYEKIGKKDEAKKMYTIGAKYYGSIDAMESLGMSSDQIRNETSGMR